MRTFSWIKYSWLFPLPFSRLFVTLEDFAGFLYIKAMQRIEKFLGSCLGKRQSRATIWRPSSIQCSAINCQKEHPTQSHRQFRGSSSSAKVPLGFAACPSKNFILKQPNTIHNF